MAISQDMPEPRSLWVDLMGSTVRVVEGALYRVPVDDTYRPLHQGGEVQGG